MYVTGSQLGGRIPYSRWCDFEANNYCLPERCTFPVPIHVDFCCSALFLYQYMWISAVVIAMCWMSHDSFLKSHISLNI